MKLYYSPGVCSLSPHIILREAGLEFDLEKVDLATGKTETGKSVGDVNPKGYVPVLELDDGEALTEGAAIVQYIADALAPGKNLAPANGTIARTRVQEHLSFVGAELHKSFTPFFKADSTDTEKQKARAKLDRRIGDIEKLLSDGRQYLMGDEFTVADAYLYTVATWTRPTEIGLDAWPNLAAYVDRVAQRPAVQEALKAEGLA
tara:strand:- start:632 stop:1243 length:612 start_codon:yes stop_codon:yes gene_type:complete